MDDDKKKTEGTALAIREEVASLTLPKAQEYAKIFIDSGLFQDTADVAKATVKILAGREIGIAPLTAMTGIHLIKGKVAIGANLMASAVKRSGKYNFRVIKHDEKECVIDFYEGTEKIGTSRYTVDEAMKAGLNREMWGKYPKNMVFARAMSNGVRWYCPDVFGCTVYDPSELKDDFPEEKEKKKGGRQRGEQTPTPVQDAEFHDVPQKPQAPASPTQTPTPVAIPEGEPETRSPTEELLDEADHTPEAPVVDTGSKDGTDETTAPSQKKYDIKIRKGMIAQGMSPRAAYNKIQEHCFKTGQSAEMNRLVMDTAPESGDYSYQIPESACAKMVKEITGLTLKLTEKTPKCLKCDNVLTEPEAVEQEGLCQVCFKKKQEEQ